MWALYASACYRPFMLETSQLLAK